LLAINEYVIIDDATEGYVHETDESSFQVTPESSGDELPPKAKQTSKSKVKQ